MSHDHHHDDDTPLYSYQKIRSKKFPWECNGKFESHDCFGVSQRTWVRSVLLVISYCSLYRIDCPLFDSACHKACRAAKK